jgi:hypothetical protein
LLCKNRLIGVCWLGIYTHNISSTKRHLILSILLLSTHYRICQKQEGHITEKKIPTVWPSGIAPGGMAPCSAVEIDDVHGAKQGDGSSQRLPAVRRLFDRHPAHTGHDLMAGATHGGSLALGGKVA